MIVPRRSTDSIRLLENGRVDFAILDIHDLAIAREHGQDIVGILPIVRASAGGGDRRAGSPQPAQLDGRTVGITGDPTDTAVLDSVVRGAAATRPR